MRCGRTGESAALIICHGRGKDRYENTEIPCLCRTGRPAGHPERVSGEVGKAIFPTQIAAMHYENETVKRLYDGLKRIVRRQ